VQVVLDALQLVDQPAEVVESAPLREASGHRTASLSRQCRLEGIAEPAAGDEHDRQHGEQDASPAYSSARAPDYPIGREADHPVTS
jgi:hypothetical protein